MKQKAGDSAKRQTTAVEGFCKTHNLTLVPPHVRDMDGRRGLEAITHECEPLTIA